MKLLVFLVLLSSTAFAQKGYQLIDRAEKAYQNHQYNKAHRLLDKAEGLDYGFCGNAWEMAGRRIKALRLDMYLARGQYALARQQLDSISPFALNIDSIRMRCYQDELGAYTLRMQLDSAVNQAKLEINDYEIYAFLPLFDSLPALCFKVQDLLLELLQEEDSLGRLRRWRRHFKASQAYQMARFVDTSYYAQIFEPHHQLDNSTNFVRLTLEELQQLDDILWKCQEEHAPKQKNRITFGRDICQIPHYKQVFPIINEKGEKILFINCFCRKFKDWDQSYIRINDGGSCFWNVKVNLSTGQYYDLYVNGMYTYR